MRKFSPITDEIYHVFNRGTEKRPIFLDKNDYSRFVVNLVLFNTEQKTIANLSRYSIESACQRMPEDPLVKIHAFSLLPNHFHLMIEQISNNGIARFMHRLEMGYSHYFNKFYSREGNLFQGAYKIVHVDNDAYRLFLPIYIHLNALDLMNSERNWKERGIKNKKAAMDFVKNYEWSSLREFLNLESMPFITHEVLDELYKNPNEWMSALKDWIPERQALFHL